MVFTATLSYNLPRIDTLIHGGLRTFFVKSGLKPTKQALLHGFVSFSLKAFVL